MALPTTVHDCHDGSIMAGLSVTTLNVLDLLFGTETGILVNDFQTISPTKSSLSDITQIEMPCFPLEGVNYYDHIMNYFDTSEPIPVEAIRTDFDDSQIETSALTRHKRNASEAELDHQYCKTRVSFDDSGISSSSYSKGSPSQLANKSRNGSESDCYFESSDGSPSSTEPSDDCWSGAQMPLPTVLPECSRSDSNLSTNVDLRDVAELILNQCNWSGNQLSDEDFSDLMNLDPGNVDTDEDFLSENFFPDFPETDDMGSVSLDIDQHGQTREFIEQNSNHEFDDSNESFVDSLLTTDSDCMKSDRNRPNLLLSAEEKDLLAREGVTIPTDLPLTKEEERSLKAVRRKIRNKVSAKESRKRKMEYMDGLEKRVKMCTAHNMQLQNKVQKLEKENTSLITQLKKLQGILKISGGKPTQARTCVLVLLMSFALFIAPHFNIFENNSSRLPTPELRKGEKLSGSSRQLLDIHEGIGDRNIDTDDPMPSYSFSHPPIIPSPFSKSHDSIPSRAADMPRDVLSVPMAVETQSDNESLLLNSTNDPTFGTEGGSNISAEMVASASNAIRHTQYAVDDPLSKSMPEIPIGGGGGHVTHGDHVTSATRVVVIPTNGGGVLVNNNGGTGNVNRHNVGDL